MIICLYVLNAFTHTHTHAHTHIYIYIMKNKSNRGYTKKHKQWIQFRIFRFYLLKELFQLRKIVLFFSFAKEENRLECINFNMKEGRV